VWVTGCQSTLAEAEATKSELGSGTAELSKEIEELKAKAVASADEHEKTLNELAAAEHKLAQSESDSERTVAQLCQKSGRVKALEKETDDIRSKLAELEATNFSLSSSIDVLKVTCA
jgi:chromosome segregation ATPase